MVATIEGSGEAFGIEVTRYSPFLIRFLFCDERSE